MNCGRFGQESENQVFCYIGETLKSQSPNSIEGDLS